MSQSVFTIDRHPRGFINHPGSAGEVYRIPTALVRPDDKSYVASQALITIEGDSNTVFRYAIDGDAAANCTNGHELKDGDEIMLRNTTSIENLAIYCQATGTGGAFKITLMG